MSSTTSHIPQHVAIIMDGNGRWAKARNKSRSAGHNAGAIAVQKTIESARQQQIKSLSLYAFSKENWRRPAQEVKHLMRLLTRVILNQKKFLMQHQVRLNPIGDLDGLEPDLVAKLRELTAATAHFTGMTLNVALNYSGQWDIANATSKLMQAYPGQQLTPEQVTELLPQYLACAGQPEIDLVIRTSGEQRISNFFLWQVAYSEFVFIPEHWPDFDQEIFARCLQEFRGRKRRFGGLDPQA